MQNFFHTTFIKHLNIQAETINTKKFYKKILKIILGHLNSIKSFSPHPFIHTIQILCSLLFQQSFFQHATFNQFGIKTVKKFLSTTISSYNSIFVLTYYSTEVQSPHTCLKNYILIKYVWNETLHKYILCGKSLCVATFSVSK